MPTKAELTTQTEVLKDKLVIQLDRYDKAMEDIKRLTGGDDGMTIRLKLDPIKLIQSNADYEAGLKRLMLNKMCRACEANQVLAKYQEEHKNILHTCPVCKYEWEEDAAFNKEGNE
jgi:predicted Zn-ribbon and HTH transcriptional regulator